MGQNLNQKFNILSISTKNNFGQFQKSTKENVVENMTKSRCTFFWAYLNLQILTL